MHTRFSLPSAFSINFSRIDELCAAEHLQNDFLHKTAAVKNVLAFSHSRGLKINEPCDIITEKPKQTRGFNDSRKSFGVCSQFEIKFLAAIVHNLMVMKHTVLTESQLSKK